MKVVIFLCIYVLLSFLSASATGRLLKKRREELEKNQKDMFSANDGLVNREKR